MPPFRLAARYRAVALHIVICTTALIATMLSTRADAAADEGLSVLQVRAIGTWTGTTRGSQERLEIYPLRAGTLRIDYIAGGGKIYTATLAPDATGPALEGDWPPAIGATRKARFVIDHNRVMTATVTSTATGAPIPGGMGVPGPSTHSFTALPGESSWTNAYVGEWFTDAGKLTLAAEGGGVVGIQHRKAADGSEQPWRRVALHRLVYDADYRNMTIHGAWESVSDATQSGTLSLRTASDGRSFSGSFENGHVAEPWSGSRSASISDSPVPPASQPPPVVEGPPATPPVVPPPVPPVVVQPAPQPAPLPSNAFKPLNRVDVRVDRVIVARGYPTHQVHALLTVKNTSAGLQYFTSGFLKALLTDADGVSLERSQPYRASGEPAELFGATPVIQPGGELKVRYVFMPEPDAQLMSLTLLEGDKRAEFPVSGL